MSFRTCPSVPARRGRRRVLVVALAVVGERLLRVHGRRGVDRIDRHAAGAQAVEAVVVDRHQRVGAPRVLAGEAALAHRAVGRLAVLGAEAVAAGPRALAGDHVVVVVGALGGPTGAALWWRGGRGIGGRGVAGLGGLVVVAAAVA